MPKLKVAIVGYGQIGPVHAQAYSNIENVEVACIVDLDEERTKKAQQDSGGNPFMCEAVQVLNKVTYLRSIPLGPVNSNILLK